MGRGNSNMRVGNPNDGQQQNPYADTGAMTTYGGIAPQFSAGGFTGGSMGMLGAPAQPNRNAAGLSGIDWSAFGPQMFAQMMTQGQNTPPSDTLSAGSNLLSSNAPIVNPAAPALGPRPGAAPPIFQKPVAPAPSPAAPPPPAPAQPAPQQNTFFTPPAQSVTAAPTPAPAPAASAPTSGLSPLQRRINSFGGDTSFLRGPAGLFRTY